MLRQAVRAGVSGVGKLQNLPGIPDNMMLGAVVVNLVKDHDEPFMIIENMEWPFLVLQ